MPHYISSVLFIIFRYLRDILPSLFFISPANVLSHSLALVSLIRKKVTILGKGRSNVESRVASFYQLNIIKFCLGFAPSSLLYSTLKEINEEDHWLLTFEPAA